MHPHTNPSARLSSRSSSDCFSFSDPAHWRHTGFMTDVFILYWSFFNLLLQTKQRGLSWISILSLKNVLDKDWLTPCKCIIIVISSIYLQLWPDNHSLSYWCFRNTDIASGFCDGMIFIKSNVGIFYKLHNWLHLQHCINKELKYPYGICY